jgi:hypothetical protein
MTTAQLRRPDTQIRDDAPSSSADATRISFRQPVSTAGYIDAAWWPRSWDLSAELPALLDVFWTAGRDINRITYNLGAWDTAPRRMQIQGRTVRLGGFATSDPLTVRLSDAWGVERVDVLVIAPNTDPGIAQRTMALASRSASTSRADEILAQAKAGTDTEAAAAS